MYIYINIYIYIEREILLDCDIDTIRYYYVDILLNAL